MKRLCVYTPTAYGGHALYTKEFVSALDSIVNEFSVELITSSDLAERYRDVTYPIHDILPPLKPKDAFRSRLSWMASRCVHYFSRESTMCKWLEKNKDVGAIHFQELSTWFGIYFLKRLKKKGIHTFCTVHNVKPHKYPPVIPPHFYDKLQQRVWLLCDGLFVHSDKLKNQLSEFLGPVHPPIHVVPHGVWTVPAPSNLVLKNKNPRQLLFFGTIRKNKGLHLLLKAMENLKEFSLVVAGYPSDAEYYDKEIVPLVSSLAAKGINVHVIPRYVADEEIPVLFTECSMLILPYTEFEAQSGVLYMAIAYQLPVVAADKGAIGEVVKEHSIGTVLEAITEESLVCAIRSLQQMLNQTNLIIRNISNLKLISSWNNAAITAKRVYLDITNQ